jgi:hypothetical protein
MEAPITPMTMPMSSTMKAIRVATPVESKNSKAKMGRAVKSCAKT